MTIRTVDLGPGSFTLGTGTPLEVSGQVTNLRVETTENVASTDPVPVLSGEELAGSDRVTFTHTLAGNLFQDLNTAGVVAYSFANAGLWVDFSFTPNTGLGAKVAGTCRVVPITIGGDVSGVTGRRGDKPRSDFSWAAKPKTTLAAMFTAGSGTPTA